MCEMQFCRFCSHMTCGDANRCAALGEAIDDAEISRPNDCARYAWCQDDALGETSYRVLLGWHKRNRRERELYAKRMRGDWS